MLLAQGIGHSDLSFHKIMCVFGGVVCLFVFFEATYQHLCGLAASDLGVLASGMVKKSYVDRMEGDMDISNFVPTSPCSCSQLSVTNDNLAT